MSEIDALLQETPQVRTARGVSARCARVRSIALQIGDARSRGVLGIAGERAGVVREVDDCVLEWKPPHAKWFLGGKLNVSVNCLDRHIENGAPQQGRVHLGGRAGRPSYAHVLGPVRRSTEVRKRSEERSACKRGDRVAIYMPLIPEVAIAMLACTRIGAIHSVVFGGFSPDSLSDRINDAKAKVLITADGGYRRGSVVPLKANSRQGAGEHAVDRARRGRAAARGRWRRRANRRADEAEGATTGGTT